jgi:hypothetical protein
VILTLVGFGAGLYRDTRESVGGAYEVTRSFYGVLKVEEFCPDDPEEHEFRLTHGSTTHGIQFTAPHKRHVPTSYYTRSSGIGRAMEHFPRSTNRRVGVVGLGTGTMATWVKAGDYLRIYEINDAVRRLAYRPFTYLTDSAARIEVVMGDARLSLEREPDQQFDLLVLDAFSSDAIPVHLLTREAFAIYLRHLQPDGAMVVHISNQYLDLEPIVLRVADHFSLGVAILHDEDHEWDEDDEEGENVHAYGSDWVVLTRNHAFLELPAIAGAATAPGSHSSAIKMWTDDESNLFRILVADDDGWLAWLRRRLLR